MNSWKNFPDGAWSSIGSALSGFKKGEGPYGTAYAMQIEPKPLLNGRVSAYIRLTRNGRINGAGVIARADKLHSFIAFYVVTSEEMEDMYSIRLATFKYGKIVSLVALKQLIQLPNNQFHIALQFFSGDMIGQIVTDIGTTTLKYTLPELPFPGYCGVVRFYDAPVIARGIHIEEIAMNPILPEEEDQTSKRAYHYSVFLSHAGSDKETVLKVVAALRKAGISYWIDHEQIMFGDGIVSKIEEGLQQSRFVVVCLSENLRTSGWCRAEYAPILYREFSGDTSRRVIPLSLDGSKNKDAVPLLLSDKMRADFTNAASFSSFLAFIKSSASGGEMRQD